MEKNIYRNLLQIIEHKRNTFKRSHHLLSKKTTGFDSNIPGSAKRLANSTSESAVAIAISSVSHHRHINSSSPLEILVAEDNELSYLLIKYILEKLSVNMHHALNGIEVVEMTRSLPHVDLILMDIRMPLMNGIEATRQIRKIMPDIPVIAQSAFTDDSAVLNSFQAGCDDFISKPINANLLLSKIILWNL